MTRLRVLFCCLSLTVLGVVTAQAMSITLVAGSGYVLRDGEFAAAIDAFTSYGTTAQMQEQMRAADSPYDLDVILITHSDFDHFDASLVVANMQTQTRSVVIAPAEVLAAIRDLAPELSETRLIDVSQALGQVVATGRADLVLSAFSFPHPPNGSRPNVGYLLTLDAITLFHPGDLDVAMAARLFDDYNLSTAGIDLAFLPSFMFMDSGLADAIHSLGARCLVPTHVRAMDLVRTCQQTRSLFDNILCFEHLGEEIDYTEEIAYETPS